MVEEYDYYWNKLIVIKDHGLFKTLKKITITIHITLVIKITCKQSMIKAHTVFE